MTLEEIRQTAATIAPVVQECVARATAPLIARIASLESDVERERVAFAERLDEETKRANVIEQIAAEQAKDSKRRVAELLALSEDIEATRQNQHSARIDDIEARLAEFDLLAVAAETAAKERAEAHADQMARTVDRYTELLDAANARSTDYDKRLEDLRSGLQAEIDSILEASKSAEPVEIPDVAQLVADAVAAMPPPENGKDAEPIDYERIVSDVRALIPTPENGKDADPSALAAMVTEAVTRAVGALPEAKDGISLAGALIDRGGNLILTLSDGTTRELGQVIGRDGKDGADGRNGDQGQAGFSLEDFDSEVRDGGRFLVLKFEAGDIKHTVEHQLDTVVYRGMHKAGATYLPGDLVTNGGNLYHANAETTERPDAGSEAWTLAARRGRDGKDADPQPLLKLIETKFEDEEARLMKRIEAYLRSKGH